MGRWTKLIIGNLAILVLLLLVAEGIWRAVDYAGSCLSRRGCSAGAFETTGFGRAGTGMMQPHPVLGHVPPAGFTMRLDNPAAKWHGKQVTIGADGLRENGQPRPEGAPMLAIGDSFTFGLFVADDQTWPACLERETGQPVANAGVSGYGTAQAVRRGQIVAEGAGYDTVILSILVGRDLTRDRQSYTNGLRRIPVVIRDGAAAWGEMPEDLSGTPWRTGPLPPVERAIGWLRRHSMIVNEAMGRRYYGGGTLRTEVAENAATEAEVLDFALAELRKIPARRHLVLLQYPRNIGARAVAAERQMVRAGVARAGLAMVDSHDILLTRPAAEVWDGHHTVLGNALVCRALVESGLF